MNCSNLGEQRLLGEALVDRLGDAEIDHLRAPARRRGSVTRMFEGLMSRWMMPF
jgi:hypothetical protein